MGSIACSDFVFSFISHSGKILTWIENWLLKQRVVVNGKLSCLMDVLSGVPQGSILEPLLFVIMDARSA